ncbi:MSHA biogenesis protein MshN [Paucimonas lemoignei]|uniref:MSHA biogenesis protein MshN n=1 Tax=Paucimonas lemoignei TaxID=29443 RepID=A0A4R3I084_PAULE|nr:tetratricopeptide repeat protein [Paucimonas lemoignei]TCS39086.1 MSHA biogenesis protein MshN [Paucimonas lemoignei]
MSLINQMLQDLDARGNQAALGGVLQGQVRAVPQRRGLNLNPAWGAAIVSAALLFAGGAWAWLHHAAAVPDTAKEISTPPAPLMPALSLKIDDVLGAQEDGLPLSPEQQMPSVETVRLSPVEHAAVLPSSATPASQSVASQAASPALALVSNQGAAPASAPAARATGAPQLSAEEPQQKAVRARPDEMASSTASAKEAPQAKPGSASALITPADAPVIAKQIKELTPRQLAENEYRKASGLIQQGRAAEAINLLEQALHLDGRHAESRQTLAALLIQARRQDEAMQILREGLQLDASQTGLAMILARLQLERSELKPAIETLQRSQAFAAERADYLAFLAALLQRDGRHKDAIDYYAQALRRSPGNAVWWMGQGISLQAENRIPEAIDAFRRAKVANGLSAELKAFVEERLNSL